VTTMGERRDPNVSKTAEDGGLVPNHH